MCKNTFLQKACQACLALLLLAFFQPAIAETVITTPVYSLAMGQGHSSPVKGVAYSPDGRYVASAGGDKIIKIWDILNKTEVCTLNGHADAVLTVDFSPDGTLIVSGSADDTVKLWSKQTCSELRTMRGHASDVQAVTFSPNGKYILSGGGVASGSDNAVILWNSQTGTEIRHFVGHGWGVSSVVFSADNSLIVSSSWDRTVKVWNTETGVLLKTFQGRTEASGFYSVALSPDGKYLAAGAGESRDTGGDGTKAVHLWSMQTNAITCTFTYPISTYWLASVNFSPDSRYLLTAGSNYTNFFVWDLQTCTKHLELSGHSNDWIHAEFSPDGRYIVSGSNDTQVLIWDAQLGSVVTKLGEDAAVNSLTVTPDSKFIFAGGNGLNNLKLIDIATQQVVRQFRDNIWGVYSVAVSPNGKYLAAAGGDSNLRLWELATGTQILKIPGLQHAWDFSPDSSKVLGSDPANHYLKIHDVVTGQEIRSFGNGRLIDGDMYMAKFSPDGRYVLAGSVNNKSVTPYQNLNLWDWQAGTYTALAGHRWGTAEVAFSPDGRTALTGWGEAKVWEIPSGNLRYTVTGAAESVAISSDGRYGLIGGNADVGTVKLIDLQNGQVLKIYQGHIHNVNTVFFTPDMRYAVSGSADKTIKVWELGLFACTYTLTPTSRTHTASAGTGSVTVTPSNSTCTWSASNNAAWTSITSGASGTGTGMVNYSVQANSGTASRNGTLTIAGQTFTVNQAGLTACTYTLTPTSRTHIAAAGTGSVTVTPSNSTCAWTAASNAAWAGITSGASGTGSGTVNYSVQANTGTVSRNATLTIGGQSFSVAQSAAQAVPDIRVSPTTLNF